MFSIIVLLLISILAAVKSVCIPGRNGCGKYATCDVEFVENAVYGCGGEWNNFGVSHGSYLCDPGRAFKQGYSICESQEVATSLGLTKTLCINESIQANYLYLSLQSSLNGDLQCTTTGVNDVFGCANPNSDPAMVNITDAINCGPFGAQLSTNGDPWKWGWQPWGDNNPNAGSDELTQTRHWPSQVGDDRDGSVMGGVVCCKDTFTGDPLPTQFTSAQTTRMNAWKSRSIYQILTDRFSKTDTTDDTACADLSKYCGGTFKGITNNLDYIEGLGYDTIWISPVVENTADGYHGYWAQDIYTINPQFGTEAEYLELVAALHDRNMKIMIDVVINHMGYGYSEDDYSMFTPFDEVAHYHDSCDNPLCENNITCAIHTWDHNSANSRLEMEECRLAGLPDLDQSNQFVADTLCDWLKNYVTAAGKWKADAIRLDTVPEVDILYWARFLGSSCSSNPDVFNIGEYFWGDPAVLADYQPVFDSMLGYPMYYTMRDVFGKQWDMTGIDDRINQVTAAAINVLNYEVLGVFLDNHDNKRMLCEYKNVVNYKNAILFQHTIPGIPIGYYGTEQEFSGCDDPANREPLWTTGFDTKSAMYKYVSQILRMRKECQMYNGAFNVIQSEADFYVYSRGDNALIVLTNRGQSFNRSIGIAGNLAYGKYCNVFATSADCFTYNNELETLIYVENGEGKLYVSTSKTFAPTTTYTTSEPSVSPTTTTASIVNDQQTTSTTKEINISNANIIYPVFTICVAVFVSVMF